MALLITLFLVLVNIFNNVTTNSPKAETLTAIEIWMLACILFVFGKYKYNPSIKNFIKILWISYIYCQSVERDHFIFHYELKVPISLVRVNPISEIENHTCKLQIIYKKKIKSVEFFFFEVLYTSLMFEYKIVYRVSQKKLSLSSFLSFWAWEGRA